LNDEEDNRVLNLNPPGELLLKAIYFHLFLEAEEEEYLPLSLFFLINGGNELGDQKNLLVREDRESSKQSWLTRQEQGLIFLVQEEP